MELTQRLECTQEVYSDSLREKTSSEQIGFLGICGTEHPLKMGPNKIGRDPQMCDIVLNLKSISRQHAVINILNSRDFMVMDLGSANKTKLSGKTLPPFLSQPLKNGDVVQFGDVFGVFRLFQENDLPMTQAMDIPDTPAHNRHVSKNNIHATTIPESPEVSDKEDSFIAASEQQPKNAFKSPNDIFWKSSGKTILIKPIGTNKIDNVYWSSSKKSDSFSMQSNVSHNLNDSLTSPGHSRTNKVHEQSIHDIDTQIDKLDTQVPVNQNENLDSIYNANTQIVESSDSLNIHEIETQLPAQDYLACKRQEQENLKIISRTHNKENVSNIYNAETQMPFDEKPVSPKDSIHNAETQVILNVKPKLSSSSNVSDDIILFDEIDNEPFENDFESQQLLSPKSNIENQIVTDEFTESQDTNFVPRKRANRIESDSSTDREEINIAPTQIKPGLNNDDDLTDCEDSNDNDIIQPNKLVENIEDLPTQILDDTKIYEKSTKLANKDDSFENLPTQIITIEENKTIKNTRKQKPDISNLPTQVLDPEQDISTCFEEALTQQIYSEEVVKFKVPLQSPIKKKRRADESNNKSSSVIEITDDDDDEKYYAATQELFNDLCSQKAPSPEVKVLNSEKNQFTKKEDSITRSFQNDSSESIDADEKISEFVSNLTCLQIQDVVGVQKDVTVLKKVPSDGSDIVATPKKIDCLSVLETDLPNTQEIKTGISLLANSDLESLKDDLSESDINSEKSTPIKLKLKETVTRKIRINLSDKFDLETKPVRSSSRVRKPTLRIQNCDETFKDEAEKILNPNLTKARKIETDRRSSNANNDKHKKEKSSKSKVEDYGRCDKNSSSAKDQHNSKKNNPTKVATENPTRIESKRERKPKQKDEMIDHVKPNIKKTTSEESNEKNHSNSTGRSTRSKQKEEEIRKNELNSNSKISKSTEKDELRTDKSNKSDKKSNKERSKSPETRRKRTKQEGSAEVEVKKPASKERSMSSELGIKKRERSKSLQTGRKRTKKERSTELEVKKIPSKERSSSPELEVKKTHSKERSGSPELGVKKKPRKERSRSPEIGTKRRPARSSEKETEEKPTKERKNSEEPINILSSKHEHSSVYSAISNQVSSDTSNDSPTKLKRPASSELEVPNAKKPRRLSSNMSILRATPTRKNKTQYVLFTAFPSDEVKNKLEKLGAVVVSDVVTCTVVLTLQIKRTFKLLCAIGLGKPIVGPDWVQVCSDTNMIVDPWQYILVDEVSERKFKFNLHRTLVGKRDFLKGYNVSCTPNVVPRPPELKLIVECSGGKWKEEGPNWVCVSAQCDDELWADLKRRGAILVTPEFILGGVLKQKAEIKKYMLCMGQMERTFESFYGCHTR
ncbi:mediator of DNA damage checkpoint protein 1-like isoform X2 [Maniola jurtina]|uniref:mediator of DNA damage checkpoint protein 1-like isoform X2 n=1 Tax=Maniola jurtina TaxID=191418 RepID=UPI001E68A578|nr:mediator of DNA damage checkpoint protein 1-like isoform X2 [Maniola jurtina]